MHDNTLDIVTVLITMTKFAQFPKKYDEYI